MAQATTNIHVETPGLLARIGTFFVQIAANNPRMRKVTFLQSLSDDQLATRGLRRDQIVRHVFADSMYV